MVLIGFTKDETKLASPVSFVVQWFEFQNQQVRNNLCVDHELIPCFFCFVRHIQRQTPKLNALLGHAEENLLTSECEDYYARKVYPAIRQRASTLYSRTTPYPTPHQYHTHPDCQSQQQLPRITSMFHHTNTSATTSATFAMPFARWRTGA